MQSMKQVQYQTKGTTMSALSDETRFQHRYVKDKVVGRTRLVIAGKVHSKSNTTYPSSS